MAKTYSTMSIEELENEIRDRQEQRDKLRAEQLELHKHLDERVREYVGEHRMAGDNATAQIVGNPEDLEDTEEN